MTREAQRLGEARDRTAHWKRWGPYLAERAWGTVREDYSPGGTAWDDLPHEHARSRGLALSHDVIAYLLNHMPRDMRTLVAILDALDGYALAAKRAITVPLVREWAQGDA